MKTKTIPLIISIFSILGIITSCNTSSDLSTDDSTTSDQTIDTVESTTVTSEDTNDTTSNDIAEVVTATVRFKNITTVQDASVSLNDDNFILNNVTLLDYDWYNLNSGTNGSDMRFGSNKSGSYLELHFTEALFIDRVELTYTPYTNNDNPSPCVSTRNNDYDYTGGAYILGESTEYLEVNCEKSADVDARSRFYLSEIKFEYIR